MGETITWIPVSERLPDADIDVLCWDAEIERVVVHAYGGDGAWIDDYGDDLDCIITHWAELPHGPICSDA